MKITRTQTRFLREQAHHLNALVRVGDNGISPALIKEINKVLAHHELIKIKIPAGDKEDKQASADEITKASGAVLVQMIGNTITIYKPNPDNPVITLPK